MANKQSKKRVPGSAPAGRGSASVGRPSAPSPRPRPSAAKRAQQRRFPVFWVAVVAVLVIAVAAAVVAGLSGNDSGTSSGSGGGSGHEFGTVVVTGKALPSLPDSGVDPAIDKTIPTVTGQNFNGRTVTIAPDGTAQMVVFLAHWCPHCNREAPKLAASLRDNGGVPAGVTLTIVPTGSSPDAPNWPPSQWVKDMGLGSVRTLVDDEQQTAAKAFGLTAYPFIVSVDAQGKVVDRRSGEQADGFFGRAFDALAAGARFPAS